jgi:hypothetical protein
MTTCFSKLLVIYTVDFLHKRVQRFGQIWKTFFHRLQQCWHQTIFFLRWFFFSTTAAIEPSKIKFASFWNKTKWQQMLSLNVFLIHTHYIW